MLFVVAHFGHWYISLPIFFGPVVVLVGALVVMAWRERRREKRGGEAPR